MRRELKSNITNYIEDQIINFRLNISVENRTLLANILLNVLFMPIYQSLIYF